MKFALKFHQGKKNYQPFDFTSHWPQHWKQWGRKRSSGATIFFHSVCQSAIALFSYIFSSIWCDWLLLPCPGVLWKTRSKQGTSTHFTANRPRPYCTPAPTGTGLYRSMNQKLSLHLTHLTRLWKRSQRSYWTIKHFMRAFQIDVHLPQSSSCIKTVGHEVKGVWKQNYNYRGKKKEQVIV